MSETGTIAIEVVSILVTLDLSAESSLHRRSISVLSSTTWLLYLWIVLKSENWLEKESAKDLLDLKISDWEDCKLNMTTKKSLIVGSEIGSDFLGERVFTVWRVGEPVLPFVVWIGKVLTMLRWQYRYERLLLTWALCIKKRSYLTRSVVWDSSDNSPWKW